jgi:hypothetical protein
MPSTRNKERIQEEQRLRTRKYKFQLSIILYLTITSDVDKSYEMINLRPRLLEFIGTSAPSASADGRSLDMKLWLTTKRTGV